MQKASRRRRFLIALKDISIRSLRCIGQCRTKEAPMQGGKLNDFQIIIKITIALALLLMH
jgi:hypothetical protein